MLKGIFDGCAAGILIGIGGSVFLSCENKVIGAVFFTVALLSICLLELQLFTGKVGMLAYSRKKSDIASLVGCLIGNTAGTFICSLLIYFGRPAISAKAVELVSAKLNIGMVSVFLSGILCGILMYTAVYCYKSKGTVAAILFCVPVFILSGFEHSIADMFYFFAAMSYTPRSILFIITVILGNSVGGLLLPILTETGKRFR